MEEITNLPDNKLVVNIKKNNHLANDSVNILLNRHGGLYVNIINSISTGCVNQTLNDDKFYILFRAADTFDPSKNVKFSTWFGNCARYHALNYINREDKTKYHTPIESKTFNSNQFTYEVKNFNNEQELLIFDKLKKLDDKRVEKIYRLRFLEDKSWKEISKEMNLSVMSCFNLFNKGKKILKIHLNKENKIET